MSAQNPVFSNPLVSENYPIGNTPNALNGTATVTDGGTITYQWQVSSDNATWSNISGATNATYSPPTNVANTRYYRVIATNTIIGGLYPASNLYPNTNLYPMDDTTEQTASTTSNVATIVIIGAQAPVFNNALVSAVYDLGNSALALDGTATVSSGTISYKWQQSSDNSAWSDIAGATGNTYTPLTTSAGIIYYRVIATNSYGSGTASATSNSATIEIKTAVAPVFTSSLVSATYPIDDASVALDGTATTTYGTITYQWQNLVSGTWTNIFGAINATFTPDTDTQGSYSYRVIATATAGTSTTNTTSNTAVITVVVASVPTFTLQPLGAEYNQGDTATAMTSTATAPNGTIAYQWQSSNDNINFSDVSGATNASYTPLTTVGGTIYYRVKATNTVGTSSEIAYSNVATIITRVASVPVFSSNLISETYDKGDTAIALNGTATATYGTITYQWQEQNSGVWENISSATLASYSPSTANVGVKNYRVIATSTLGTSNATATSNIATITTIGATLPVFSAPLVSSDYGINDTPTTLNGLATAVGGTINYKWQTSTDGTSWADISGAVSATYTPPTNVTGTKYYRVLATNIVGSDTITATSNNATISIYTATAPIFTTQPTNATYEVGAVPNNLIGVANVVRGQLQYQWERYDSNSSTWLEISGAVNNAYSPSTAENSVTQYRLIATNVVGTSQLSSTSNVAVITIIGAELPVFKSSLPNVTVNVGAISPVLDGEATVNDGGVITYQWYNSFDNSVFNAIAGATSATYTLSTQSASVLYYYVEATNTKNSSTISINSNVSIVEIKSNIINQRNYFQEYLNQLDKPFLKLCRLRFLNPDNSTAFAIDNNPNNPRSNAFIQNGSINCNLTNGTRRTANITLANVDNQYNFNYNKVWFGQQVALDEGLILPDGFEFYVQQGVFYIQDPQEIITPTQKSVEYTLVDKWAYLDGTLFGNLETIYEVPVDVNIFEALVSVLLFDRGNGIVIDDVLPIITEWYNGKTQTLPDGTTVPLTNTPYTLRVDNDSGTYADVILGLSEMLAAWIGYDQTGALRLDPSQDDILDTNKPIQYEFDMNNSTLLGLTYFVKNTQVYNDYIVVGELLDDNSQPAGRATNEDPNSETNIFSSLGRRTYRESKSGYTTTQQCVDLATWKLKRSAILQSSVTISCSQMFHIVENNLVTVLRTDKEGSPIERHLITGFSRPLTQTGNMTINCTSVNDFPIATTRDWPEI